MGGSWIQDRPGNRESALVKQVPHLWRKMNEKMTIDDLAAKLKEKLNISEEMESLKSENAKLKKDLEEAQEMNRALAKQTDADFDSALQKLLGVGGK